MTSPIEPRTASLYHASRGSAVAPSAAAAILMAAIATYLVVPAVVPAELAMLVAQAALVAVPLAAVLLGQLGRPLAALGLRGARPRYFAAAIAIGATTWYVNLWLVSLLPLPDAQVQALQALVDRPSLGVALALFALVPAACEEILFRGVLARALGRHLPLAGAAAISALVFAAYHLSIIQALPTLTFGFVLAIVAIRADSILPTFVAHALNNTLAVLMSRDELPGLAAWLMRHPVLSFGVCATTCALGVTVAARGRA